MRKIVFASLFLLVGDWIINNSTLASCTFRKPSGAMRS
jgi:hypothetical protein